MTLQELYENIGGDYEQAMRTLRIEKLMDKHIRKLPENAIFAELVAAGNEMDATRIFESAHAIKGVCANLGLMKLSALASEICDEFRPGCERKRSDGEIQQKIRDVDASFQKAAQAIREYAAGTL